MTLILLEALLALAILVAIVWWTMFAGRKKGELPSQAARNSPAPSHTAAADQHPRPGSDEGLAAQAQPAIKKGAPMSSDDLTKICSLIGRAASSPTNPHRRD